MSVHEHPHRSVTAVTQIQGRIADSPCMGGHGTRTDVCAAGTRACQLRAAGALACILVLCAPVAANADEPQLVERRVTRVTGVDVASSLLHNVERIEFGSDSATFTLDVEGTSTPLAVDYAGLTGEDGRTGGIGASASLGLLSVGILNAARFVSRLHGPS